MRTLLDQWFVMDKLSLPNNQNYQNDHNNQKTIFYFNSKTMKSSWLHDKPKNISFSTTINWNQTPITLCTNLEQYHSYVIPKETKYNDKHMTFIKSNLQKCIRRKSNVKAIKTAYHMIKLNINEFLRRISIIIIEDVILHESYSTIVWLMAITSSKKSTFILNKNIIDWLLGLVDTLCNIDECCDLSNLDKYDIKYNITELNDYDLLYSLQFRISYGVMCGDMEMLNYVTGVWLQLFKDGKKCNTETINSVDYNTIDVLEFEEWKLDGNNIAGIDFHCAPYMLEMICMKYDDYSEDEIKSAIWNCSSKVNYRKKDNINKDTEIWNNIKNEVFNIQKYILDKYLK
jgi:hypothetical protein